MSQLLVIAFPDKDGKLAPADIEVLGAAKTLSESLQCDFSAGLIGENINPAAEQAAGAGANTIYGVTDAAFKDPRYATDALAVYEICKTSQADTILSTDTSRLSRIMAGVSVRLGGRIDTHVTNITVENGAPAITRWFYRQRMQGTLQREQRPWIITCASGCFTAPEISPGNSTIQPVAVDIPPTLLRSKVEGIQSPPAEEQTIRPDADLLFVAGAGWCKTQTDGQQHADIAEKSILAFLDKAKASLGSSKSLVDQSGEGHAVLPFMTHLNQVGQTGSTPRHPKGLATCCHGEEPHVVGWRFINERRAINLDANCGWAQGKADVVYVGDAFEIMAKVNEKLAGS